jgi:hypothetical protein
MKEKNDNNSTENQTPEEQNLNGEQQSSSQKYNLIFALTLSALGLISLILAFVIKGVGVYLLLSSAVLALCGFLFLRKSSKKHAPKLVLIGRITCTAILIVVALFLVAAVIYTSIH